MNRTAVLMGLMLAALALGCTRQTALPIYPRMDDRSALQVLADRGKAVKSISAQGTLRLTKPDGESVRLDSAVASRPPDQIRLRAWKFSQAVFDLTITPAGAWLVAPREHERRDDILVAGQRSAEFARVWTLFTMFDDPKLATEIRGSQMIVRKAIPDEPAIVCYVDRATLTPRRYEMQDEHGVVRFSVNLERYDLVNGIAWPRRATAKSDAGEIVLDLREVELNGELPPRAFIPPARAERLP